jgi:mycofactocin glycosyltransferase
MSTPLPDRVKEVWRRVDAGQMTAAQAQQEQDRLLAEHREVWTRALVASDEHGLRESLMNELAAYLGSHDIAALEAQCRNVGKELKSDWERTVNDRSDGAAIERFYDQSRGYLLDLMWWHTLQDDPSPLAYVVALEFARRCHGRRYLDFGAGVGAGAILFARHGYDVALADISSTLLEFSRWRLDRRGLCAATINLSTQALPRAAYDYITAMDVFEHLADPVTAADNLAAALAPGGYLFARFAADPDPERPQHIVFEFEPTLQRLAALGLREVWKDDWLWGHQVFQKPPSSQ